MKRITFQALVYKFVLVVVTGFWLLGAVVPPVVYGSRWEYLNTDEGVDLYQALQTSEGSLPFRASADLDVPYQLFLMLPYLLTILALGGAVGRAPEMVGVVGAHDRGKAVSRAEQLQSAGLAVVLGEEKS